MGNPSFVFRPIREVNLNPRNDLQPPPYVTADRGYRWRSQRSWDLSTEFEKAEHQKTFDRWWNYDLKWRNGDAWKGSKPGFFSSSNVSLDRNEPLTLRAKRETASAELERLGYKDISTSFVRSYAEITYGYVEILCRLGDSTVSSAFWLKEVPYTDSVGIKRHERKREIDVFEYSTSQKAHSWLKGSKFENIFHTNTHWKEERQGAPDNEAADFVDVGRNLSKEQFLKVGILWGREKICWYLNDGLVREEKVDGNTSFNRGGHFNQFVGEDAPKMHIQFDRETMGWFGEPGFGDKMSAVEGDFKVYYCRTWKM